MKKLLLLAAGAFVAFNASAGTWKVMGQYSGWIWDNSTELISTSNNDVLSCTISDFDGWFKIVEDNWSGGQFGLPSSSPYFVLNETAPLEGKTSDYEPSDIFLPFDVRSISNATFNFNPTAGTLEIVVAENNITYGLPRLYVVGSFSGWAAPGEDGSVLCSENNGIYTATVDLGTSGEVNFKLAGNDWKYDIAGGVEVSDEEAIVVTYGGSDLKTSLTGQQTLVFNYNTMSMTFGQESLTEAPEEAQPIWALVGAYSDPSWNFDASAILEGSGNSYSCTISNLISDFKIVDISKNNWDVQYGTSTPIQLDKTYVLEGKNGGDDPSNMSFGDNILSVANAVVTWNPETYEMKITGTPETGFPTLYVTGSFTPGDGWAAPGEEGSVLCIEEDGIYTATVNLGTSGDVEFKLAGAGWSNEIAGGVEVGTTPVEVTKGGKNLHTTLTGEWTLVFDYNDMTMYFEGDDSGNVPPTPKNPIWAVVGAYTTPNWNFEASTILEGEGDELSCVIENLTNDFKIVDISENNWDKAYGYNSPININTAYTLAADGDNISFEGLIQTVKNAKVLWNPSTYSLTIQASEDDLVIAYPTLYVTGSFTPGDGWAAPGDEGSVLCTEENGIYMATVDLGTSGDVQFKLASQGWSNEIAGGVEVDTTPVEVTKGGENLHTTLTGEWTLVFDYSEMTMYFKEKGTDDDNGEEGPGASGIDSILSGSADAEYFTLQGIKVNGNPAKGIYIVKQSGKTFKVYVK